MDEGAGGSRQEASEAAGVPDESNADGDDLSGPHGIDAELTVDDPEGWEFHFEEDHTVERVSEAPAQMTTDEAEAIVGLPSRVRIYRGGEVRLSGQFGGEVPARQQISIGINYLADGDTPCDADEMTADGWENLGSANVNSRSIQVMRWVRSSTESPVGESTQYRLCEDAGDWEILAYGNRFVSRDDLVRFYSNVGMS